MSFDPDLAAIRFGTGLSPLAPPPASVDEMIGRLAGPDEAAARWPIDGFDVARPSLTDGPRLNRIKAEPPSAEALAAAEAESAVLEENRHRLLRDQPAAMLARAIGSPDGLRERLHWFWLDHFTIKSKNGGLNHLVPAAVETAIRPNIAGRFRDLLMAVVTQPMMLRYLDQASSVGPTSGARGGLNENYARELLELHTLGVDGPYAQTDVRELAELLTGLTVEDGLTVYDPTLAEPGNETVLGTRFPRDASFVVIERAIDMLASHPATAHHMARKLAVHFVADDPPAELVDDVAARFTASDGDLVEVTRALLSHPAAWTPEREKVKWPIDYVVSGLRALGVTGEEVAALDWEELRRVALTPMDRMGQPWFDPAGPDGWAEEPEAWVTAATVAARIDWAMIMPRRLRPDLPDPRDFVVTALGSTAGDAVRFAASAAETQADGVGVVLASADFQRR